MEVMRGGSALRVKLRRFEDRIAHGGASTWGPILVVITLMVVMGVAVLVDDQRSDTTYQIASAPLPSTAVLPPNASVTALDTLSEPERPSIDDPNGDADTEDPAPEPTEDPDDPEPTPTPTEPDEPEPTREPDPTEDPTDDPAGEPTDQPVDEPVEEPTDQPAEEPTDDPELPDDPAPEPTDPDGFLDPFRGLSTWIDVYDVDMTPQQQIDIARAAGVEVLYVQSGKYDSPDDIHHAERLSETIELAHDVGMEVMLWYVPDFADYERDLRRVQAAIDFTTERGDTADAFGLDIEMETVADIDVRNERLVRMSADLREYTGDDYPLAAIVLPPLQLELRPDWWPDFPWAEMPEYYDAVIPMSYSSFRGTDAATTYQWNYDNVIRIREKAQANGWPVHIAGGLANDLPEVDVFVDAARDANVIGGGLYDLHITPPEAWPHLRELRAGD